MYNSYKNASRLNRYTELPITIWRNEWSRFVFHPRYVPDSENAWRFYKLVHKIETKSW